MWMSVFSVQFQASVGKTQIMTHFRCCPPTSNKYLCMTQSAFSWYFQCLEVNCCVSCSSVPRDHTMKHYGQDLHLWIFLFFSHSCWWKVTGNIYSSTVLNFEILVPRVFPFFSSNRFQREILYSNYSCQYFISKSYDQLIKYVEFL